MGKAKVLAFAGSAREGSFNKKLIAIAAAGAKEAGADVTLVDLREFPMPLYDGDLEAREGLPENAKKLKALFLSHQALLISSPEYNSSYSPLFKNTIDWVSRQEKGEEPLAAYKGKIAGLMSASPGGLGGLRGLVHVRAVLGNIHVLVIPDQLAVSTAHEAFGSDGSLKDLKQQSQAKQIGAKVAQLAARLL